MLDLKFPDGVDPAEALAEYDKFPKILPEFPLSDKMVVCCVRRVDAAKGDSSAVVVKAILSEAELEEAVIEYPETGLVLFFTVRRSALIEQGWVDHFPE